MFGLNDGDPKQWYVTIFIIGEKLKGSTFLLAWQLTKELAWNFSWDSYENNLLMIKGRVISGGLSDENICL